MTIGYSTSQITLTDTVGLVDKAGRASGKSHFSPYFNPSFD